NLAALDEGLKNLERHVKNMEKFGTTPVVALNLFTSDTDVEREHVAEWAEKLGVRLAESTVWAEGGAGATERAQQVLEGTARVRRDPAGQLPAALRSGRGPGRVHQDHRDPHLRRQWRGVLHQGQEGPAVPRRARLGQTASVHLQDPVQLLRRPG